MDIGQVGGRLNPQPFQDVGGLGIGLSGHGGTDVAVSQTATEGGIGDGRGDGVGVRIAVADHVDFFMHGRFSQGCVRRHDMPEYISLHQEISFKRGCYADTEGQPGRLQLLR